MNASDTTTSAGSRRIVLDATTDTTLAESLTALAPDDHDRLLRVVRERLLIDKVRACLAEQFPTRTPIGVLFEPGGEDSDGSYLHGEGTVVFDGGTVDYLYDDDLESALQARWPVVGRDFQLAIDLRGEGTITVTHDVDADMYTRFNVTPPA